MTTDLGVPDLMPTAFYELAEAGPGEKLFDTSLLPTCPHCGGKFVPLADGRGGMTTSHGVVDDTPVCVGAPLPATRPVRRRTSRAAAAAAAKSEAEQIEAAAQHIYQVAIANRLDFTASLWRGPMDRAGVPDQVRRRAVVYAIRAGWIEAVNLVADFEFGDDHSLEQYDRRKTRWRSLVYIPLRRRRPTTNGPSR